VDWTKLKAEYIAGGTSYRKLAKKHNVSFQTLQGVAKRENWVELKRRAQDKTDTKIVNVVSSANAKIDDKYFRCVDMLLDKAEELIELTPIWQVTTLKEMATAMKYLKECKGVKSDADMREQEARIDKLRKDAMEEQKDTTIEVVMGEEVDDYAN
jgi:hypothetical protein